MTKIGVTNTILKIQNDVIRSLKQLEYELDIYFYRVIVDEGAAYKSISRSELDLNQNLF